MHLASGVGYARLTRREDDGVALLLADPGEDPLQLPQDLRPHVLLLPLELLLEIAREPLGVAKLALVLVLLVPAGVGREELPLLLELVTQLVELDLVTV